MNSFQMNKDKCKSLKIAVFYEIVPCWVEKPLMLLTHFKAKMGMNQSLLWFLNHGHVDCTAEKKSHFLWETFRKSVSCPMCVFDTPACAKAFHHKHILEGRLYCCLTLAFNLTFPLCKPNCFAFMHMAADSIHWNKFKSMDSSFCINVRVLSFLFCNILSENCWEAGWIDGFKSFFFFSLFLTFSISNNAALRSSSDQ